MKLYRVTLTRQVEELAEVEVREESPTLAAQFAESALRSRSPILPVDWCRSKVIRPPKVVAAAEAK